MTPLILKANNVPTEPGWYWWCRYGNSVIRDVRRYEGRLGIDRSNGWGIIWIDEMGADDLFSDRFPDPIAPPPKPRVGWYKHANGVGGGYAVEIDGKVYEASPVENRRMFDVERTELGVKIGDRTKVNWYDEPTPTEKGVTT